MADLISNGVANFPWREGGSWVRTKRGYVWLCIIFSCFVEIVNEVKIQVTKLTNELVFKFYKYFFCLGFICKRVGIM